MSIFPLIFFLFFTISLSSLTDEDSRLFFKGFISSSLDNLSWSDPIINYVNSSNFPINSLLKSTDILLKNSKNHEIIGSFEAFSQISLCFSQLLNALFPIISFSLRFDGIRRFIPENNQQIFDILNETFVFYAENRKNLVLLMTSSDYSGLLSQILQHENNVDFFNSGVFFKEFSGKLQDEVRNSKRIAAENNSDLFLMGLLKGLGINASFIEEFTLFPNSNIFNEHQILEEFNFLSQNSLNFTNKDSEVNFLENIAKIGFFLKNIRNSAKKYAKKQIFDELSYVFELFNRENELEKRIIRVREGGVDVRVLFKSMYLEGEIEGNYEEAGKTFAKVCRLLEYKDQISEGFFMSFLNFLLRFFK